MEQKEVRPPYVTFTRRSVEDRNASIEKGYYVTKDVDYAVITPVGGKLTVEKPAEEWLKEIAHTARADQVGRFPPAWVDTFRTMYESWKRGEELPENGVPIKGWAVLSPAQQEQIIRANVRTVEDLAQANEEALAMMGMGGRALKQRAIDWLTARKDPAGQISGELASLRAALADKDKLLEAAMEKIAGFEKEFAAMKSKATA